MKNLTLFQNRKLTGIVLAIALTILAAVFGLFYQSNYAPLIFLGIVIGIIIVISWLLKPVWALYVTIFLLLLPAGSIPDATRSMLNRSLTIVAFGIWLIGILIHRQRIFWPSSTIIMLTFVLWCMASFLWATNTNIALTFIQLYALRFMLFLFLIPNEIRTKKDLDGLFLTLALAGLVFIGFSIAGLIQDGYTPGSRFKVLDVNENDIGILLMVTLLGALWWSSKSMPGNYVLKRLCAGIFFLLVVGFTAISGSRGSAISLFIAIAAFSLWRPTRPWAILGLCVLVVGALTFPSLFLTTLNRFLGVSGDSLSLLGGREPIWQAAWRLISDHPLLGVGIGNASYAILPYLGAGVSKESISLHNPILVIWSETGLLGILLYLGVMVTSVVSFIRQYFLHRKFYLEHNLILYFAIVSSIFLGFMASWFKGGSMEISHVYFLMLSLLLIPAGLDLSTVK